ncbi:hypothetical protein K1T71_001986 [Dendrolimus kikuchii]|uniref:Uncharacterized protein n=1 Tax=Dendrolimus kikuchii TaxID=765133 RepID=A0ACC1DGR8_9NEOP|nr:hypothetical protein K1T71_001986 [Dendrolimus kikuchii]
MSFTHSQLIKYQTALDLKSHLNAEIFYPKLVIFEDVWRFRIVDLTSHEVEECHMDEEIVYKRILDGLLWIILKSGQIILMNILTNATLKLITNLRIHSIQLIMGLLILRSKSEEYYEMPFTTKDLQDKISDGLKELVVNLKITKLGQNNKRKEIKIESNELLTYIENGTLKVKCPITGLITSIDSDLSLEYLLTWEENLILSNKFQMFIIDSSQSRVVYTFESTESKYYPVGINDGCLYYLIWNNNEVQVWCTWLSSSIGDQDKNLNNFSQLLFSQETLISQLKSLVDSVLSDPKNLNINVEMQELYDKINDFSFLIETSIKLCKHSLLYKSLLYPLQKRVYQFGTPDLMALLLDLIIKVDLLEYIIFKGNKSYENVKLFEQNFKELCVMFISKSDIDLASICWLKYFEIKIELSPDDILDILNAIPHNTKMGAIIIWLQHFVPPLLEYNPYNIDLFVRWTTNRVFKLEQSGYWPKIGIKFLEEIIKVLEKSSKTITIRPISMDDLDMLLNHVKYILELKDNCKINMLLSEITLGPQEVALIMLRRCYTDDLEAFLQNYLPAYAIQHLLDIDDILKGFIENEIAYCGGQVDGIRLKVLLNAFHSLTSRLNCLLQVLKVLDVPWHPTILELAISAATSVNKDFTMSDKDHMLAKEIQKELIYCKVKVVMKKYNFPLTFIDYKLILHKLISAPKVDLNDLNVITNVMTCNVNYGHILYINRCLQDCEIRIALNYFRELSKIEKALVLKTVLAKLEQIISKSSSNHTLERNYLDFIKGTQCLSEVQFRDIELLYHHKNNKNINTHYENSKSQELLVLLHQTSTSQQVRRFVSNLLCTNKISPEIIIDEPSSLRDFKDGQNLVLLVEAWKVLIEVLEKCKEEHLHDIIIQVYELSAIINSTIVVKNLSIAWKFHYIHLPISSAPALNELIDFYSIHQLDKKLDTDVSSISKCDIILLRLVSIALNTTTDYSYSTELLMLLQNKAARRLLSQIVSSQNIDEIFVTSLLLASRTDEEIDNRWILDALQGHNENISPNIKYFLSSAPIQRTFELNSDIFGNTVSYSPHHILKIKFNINLSEIAIPENTEETWDVKVILFYVLKQRPYTRFTELLEYCHALNIPYGEGLSLQLISLISNWNLNYKIFYDELGQRQVEIEDDENNLYTTCHAVWESIEKKDVIRDVLNDFWKNGEITLHGRVISINPYFYEVFLCIYRLIFGSGIESKNLKEYFLLSFLKEYRRKSTPKQYELEIFSGAIFPEIGYFRLPFHLFMRDDKWANLKSEITLETYERWLPVVALLSLDTDQQTARDMICSNALKQTMTSRRQTKEECSKDAVSWHLTSREEPLLRAAHRCVTHIANMEWTGACLFYLLQGCARGADQVAAAQLCYQFTQRWTALQPGNRALRQMERLYATLSTRHALYKIDWTCDNLVRLTNEPAQLIRELYLHTDFIKKIARHNVNRAANEIADKNGINISSIRLQILENILNKSKQDSTKNKNQAFLDTIELLTVKYILKATCPKMGAIYLSRIAFDDEADFNKGKKLRALQCLMSIVEPDTALKVANRERDTLWLSLLELLCVVKLENIDMPWVVVTFLQDKVCALKQSLQTVEGNSEGLKIVAELTYWFGTPEIICDVILNLLRIGLYEEIIPLLMKVSSPPNNVLSTAWRAVLLSPFQRADYPITEQQRTKCLNAINLLPVCPVIKDEDLVEIWKNCVRCKCLGLGCLLLPYMSLECRKSLNELSKVDRRNLIVSLKNLQSETYLVSGAMNVIENLTPRNYR